MTTATIILFPLANRRSMILRQARYVAVLSPVAAEHYIRQQLKVQARLGWQCPTSAVS
jgi:hypothetical protein